MTQSLKDKITIIILITWLLIFASTLQGCSQNAIKQMDGNYIALNRATDTTHLKWSGHTFTDKDGKIYQLYVSPKANKLYYLKTSKKTNKPYPVYIKTES